jgi:hypothetical protein
MCITGEKNGKHMVIHYNGILLPGDMVAENDIEEVAGEEAWFVQRYWDRRCM